MLFCKADSFFRPSSTWTVQIHADAGMPHAQDCPVPLIDSTSGHYNNTGMHNPSIWLAFHASIQQGEALESAFVAFNGMSMHCPALISSHFFCIRRTHFFHVPFDCNLFEIKNSPMHSNQQFSTPLQQCKVGDGSSLKFFLCTTKVDTWHNL